MNDDPASMTHADRKSVQVPEPFQTSASFSALFWKPRFLLNAPTTEHLPLLYWLSSVLRPHNVEVLGCDDGAVCFSLCQAIDQLGLDAQVRSFGFWKDPKSGKAVPPPALLRRHRDMLYQEFSRMVSCESLDNALASMSLESVDLLFVDLNALPDDEQLHCESLLGYVSSGGLLLVHGTAKWRSHSRKNRDFVRFLSTHPHVEFSAGDGMVLIVGEGEFQLPLRALMSAAPNGVLRRDVERVFQRCGQGLLAAAELEVQGEGRRSAEKKIAEADKELQELKKDLQQLREVLERRSTHLAELQSEMYELRSNSVELTKALERSNHTLSERQAACLNTEAALEEERQAHARAKSEYEAERSTRFSEVETLTRIAEEVRATLAETEAEVVRIKAQGDAALEEERQAHARAKSEYEAERSTRFSEVETLTRIAEEVRKELSKVQKHNQKLLTSTSWRVTAPMRFVKRTMSKDS